jgi:hypothetical protein
MAQETLDSLIQVIFTLPMAEQEQVVMRLQENIDRVQNSELDGLSAEEKDALETYLVQRAESAVERISQGHYCTHEEAKQKMNQYIQERTRVAV